MLKNAGCLGMCVAVVCVFVSMGIACVGSVFGGNNEQSSPALSAQANVSFTTMLNEKLAALDPNACDATCYAKTTIDTYISYRTQSTGQ